MQTSPLALALGAFTLISVPAYADPVTPRTITGYSASAASQQGAPLEVPPGRGPLQDQASLQDQTPVTAEAGAEAGAGGQGVRSDAALAQPRKVRYGLFGMSWRSQ